MMLAHRASGRAAGAVFLAPDCPARGHRVKGAPYGRVATRSAAADPGPAVHSQGFRTCEDDGEY
jgi:hypothetical protein